jgi:hypothetical protein
LERAARSLARPAALLGALLDDALDRLEQRHLLGLEPHVGPQLGEALVEPRLHAFRALLAPLGAALLAALIAVATIRALAALLARTVALAAGRRDRSRLRDGEARCQGRDGGSCDQGEGFHAVSPESWAVGTVAARVSKPGRDEGDHEPAALSLRWRNHELSVM